MTAPTRRMIGFWRAGRTNPTRYITTGIPMMAPTQMKRYSLTFSFRSARARSRAMFAPKSRCSTALLSWEIAALWEINSPSEADEASPFFGSCFPDAYRSRRALTPVPEPVEAIPTAMRRMASAAIAATIKVGGTVCPPAR